MKYSGRHRSGRAALLSLVLGLIVAQQQTPHLAQAFVVGSRSRNHARATTTALELTPSQGSHLAAAFDAACHRRHHLAHQDDDDDEDVDDEVSYARTKAAPVATTTAARTKQQQSSSVSTKRARDLVSRLFSLPASLANPHDNALEEQPDEDVVYYPVVGFTYVQDAPGHSRALPAVMSKNVACRLHFSSQNEEYYGSWSVPTTSTATSSGHAADDESSTTATSTDGLQP